MTLIIDISGTVCNTGMRFAAPDDKWGFYQPGTQVDGSLLEMNQGRAR